MSSDAKLLEKKKGKCSELSEEEIKRVEDLVRGYENTLVALGKK